VEIPVSRDSSRPTPRREFIKQAGVWAALGLHSKASGYSPNRIAIVLDPRDEVDSSASVRWAAEQLQLAIKTKGEDASIIGSPEEMRGAQMYIPVRRKAAEATGLDAFSLIGDILNGRPATVVSGRESRGLTYGLLELADRVRYAPANTDALTVQQPIVEQSPNLVRSIARAFCSEIEDKAWYYDKDFWRGYLTELATQRFNRFNLTFGIGYDFPRGVTGDYFHFLYPYLLDVPDYKVRVVSSSGVPLSDAERGRNLEMLRFIVAETALRGLDFQLGIWTHAYQWTDSPKAHHHIDGLTPQNHAAYCRDALALLLKTCPEIGGLTLRVHGESGIPEGSYDFWQTVFQGITSAHRRIEIDMHAKGVDQRMIDIAVNTGMPVKLSPKFWAEHMGLGYHQADIRELEMPRPDRMEQGTFALSNGSRRFLRYGYGDLLRRDRRYNLLFRLWPGTQRTLLWGDPPQAAAYGRTSHFCGAAGIDICEPLFFKGREGSDTAGGRCAYSDKSLSPRYDWEKYTYTYRIWGRLLYDPDADPQSWRRYLNAEFGNAAGPLEIAISNGSRVLPIVTTAHLPSASNHSFWPEIYTNMPIVLGSEPSPYSDTPDPKRFGTVSPLDPELLSSIAEYVGDLLNGRQSRKFSPAEVAQWLEDCSMRASDGLAAAAKQAPSIKSPAYRRMHADVEIESGLGQFFASKLRSAVLFEIYLQTGNRGAGEAAVAEYRKARQCWASLAQFAGGVYLSDIAYGASPNRRGDWTDRLPGIDTDLRAMEAAIRRDSSAPVTANAVAVKVTDAIRDVRTPNRPNFPKIIHQPATSFQPGSQLNISLVVPEGDSHAIPASAKLHYRHVNHAERWVSIDMERRTAGYTAAIPAEYTNSEFPLQYYFELRQSPTAVGMWPGLNGDLANQPYFVIMQTGG
jgi:hypothetical protein